MRLDYLFFETKQEGLIQMNTNTHLNAGARGPEEFPGIYRTGFPWTYPGVPTVSGFDVIFVF
jgi:hypothetical protein